MPPFEGANNRYIDARIEALTRNGSIKELRREAEEIRRAVAAAVTKVRVNYAWARDQLERAEAFEAEAQRLDDNRPHGPRGLMS